MRITIPSPTQQGFTFRLFCATVVLSAITATFASTAAEPKTPTAKADETLRYPGKEKRDALLNSIEQLEKWIQADSDEAANYVGLADIYTFLWCYGFSLHSEVMPNCEKAAKKALELTPDLASAHTALGIVLLGQRNWDEAEHQLRLATELDPNRAQAHHWYALYLSAMGRHDEASKHSKLSLKLDSTSGMKIARSSIQYFDRDWQGMIDVLKPTIEQNANYAPAYDWLGMAYIQQNQFDLSITTYLRAAELSDGLAEVLGGLGHAYGVAGREEEARQVLDKLYRLAEQWHVPPVQVAFVHVGLGEKQKAIDLLETAYEQRSWELVFLQVEAWLDDLRAEPRFIKLVEKMNFPK